MDITTNQLLSFFKVMADESRLKIVGLMAQQPRTGEELAMLLGLGASTISHHMSKLQKAGLVQAQAQQYYSVFSLNQLALQDMAVYIATALKPEAMMNVLNETKQIDQDAFDKSVIEKAMKTADTAGYPGMISWPTSLMRLRIILRWVGRTQFEPSKRYTELQVDDILERIVLGPDTNSERRELVGEGILSRKSDGTFYWRTDTLGAGHPGFNPDELPLSAHVVTTERLIERKVLSTYVHGGRFMVPETNDDGMQAHVLKALWKTLRLRFFGTLTPDEALTRAASTRKDGAWASFDRNKAYTEAQVDSAIAKMVHGDPARIRRLLVEHKYLVHRKKTNAYLRADAGEAEPTDVLAAHIEADRITHLPEDAQERTVVLAWLAEKFPPRKRLHRDDLDAIIDAHKPSRTKTDEIRNALLQAEFLDRKGDVFWRAA